jgi:hypothetical protein
VLGLWGSLSVVVLRHATILIHVLDRLVDGGSASMKMYDSTRGKHCGFKPKVRKPAKQQVMADAFKKSKKRK